MLLASKIKNVVYAQTLNLYGLVCALVSKLSPTFTMMRKMATLKRTELWERLCQKEVDAAKKAKDTKWIKQANELLTAAIVEREVAAFDLKSTGNSKSDEPAKQAQK